MNKDQFKKRLSGSANLADLLHNIREGLDSVEILDSEGERLTRDYVIFNREFESESPDCPPWRVIVTFEHLRICSRGVKIEFPLKAACEIFEQFQELHVIYHEAIIAALTHVRRSLMTENEKVIRDL